MGFFDKKNPIFWKIDKGSEFAVKCDWISNISQHLQRMRFRKQDWLSGKKLWGVWKALKAGTLLLNATEVVGFL